VSKSEIEESANFLGGELCVEEEERMYERGRRRDP
jgi:hypothetical protein